MSTSSQSEGLGGASPRPARITVSPGLIRLSLAQASRVHPTIQRISLRFSRSALEQTLVLSRKFAEVEMPPDDLTVSGPVPCTDSDLFFLFGSWKPRQQPGAQSKTLRRVIYRLGNGRDDLIVHPPLKSYGVATLPSFSGVV